MISQRMHARASGGTVERRRTLVALVGACVLGMGVPGACILGTCILGAGPLAAERALAAPDPIAADSPAPCDCAHFAAELEAARAFYASRGEGATIRLSAAARARFRERLLGTYDRAHCLVGCAAVSEPDRDQVRVLLATAAFKSRRFGPSDAAAQARLTLALAETERCVAHDPALPACHLWHASIRGVLAKGSWNPMQLALPKQLLAEFRAARAGAPPGSDPPDGAATRAEATLLLRAPGIAGGDAEAARRLMEEATRSPLYVCTVANRLVYGEALTRTGAPARAVAELRAALDSGLPSCGDDRYENADDLEDVVHCLDHLESHPNDDPGWDHSCR